LYAKFLASDIFKRSFHHDLMELRFLTKEHFNLNDHQVLAIQFISSNQAPKRIGKMVYPKLY